MSDETLARMRLFRAPTGHDYVIEESETKETTMGLKNKAKNTGEALKGDVKEKTGKATGNQSLRAEGKVDSAKGNLKQAGEKVKDAL